MKRFKQFLKLDEALKKKHKDLIDSVTPKTRNIGFSDHVFNGSHGIHPSGDPDRITIPFEGTHPVTGKSQSITFSRQKYDVAGMSTKKKWDSCMNCVTGVNRRYIPHELSQGTHVAYLHDSDDTDVKSPHARLALKPFHKSNESTGRITHTILFPEPSSYHSRELDKSKVRNDFENTVKSFTKKSFPLQKTGTYRKDPHVYSDDARYTLTHKDQIDKSLEKLKNAKGVNRNEAMLGAIRATKHPEFGQEHIEKHFDTLMQHGFHKEIGMHGSKEHIYKALKHPMMQTSKTGVNKPFLDLSHGFHDNPIQDTNPKENNKILHKFLDHTMESGVLPHGLHEWQPEHRQKMLNHPHPKLQEYAKKYLSPQNE